MSKRWVVIETVQGQGREGCAMPSYTREDIEAHIEVLRCCADINYQLNLDYAITTGEVARDLGLVSADEAPQPCLHGAAWSHARGLSSEPFRSLGETHANICLEAAMLLEEGWLPS